MFFQKKKKEISGNICHEGQDFSYLCIFDRYKTIRLRLKSPDLIEIKMPFRTPVNYAEKTILKHWDWILAKREQLADMREQSIKSEREEVFLLGRAFQVTASQRPQARWENLQFSACQTYFNQEEIFLQFQSAVQNAHKAVHVMNGQVFVQCGKNGEKEFSIILHAWRKKSAEQFLSWYYRELWNIFSEKVGHVILQRGIKTSWHTVCPPLTVRSCKRCFGSCRVRVKSRQTGIMLSRHLMGLPLEYIEFVILHELSHLIYQNHSLDFYDLLDIVLPRHKIIRASINQWAKTHTPF